MELFASARAGAEESKPKILKHRGTEEAEKSPHRKTTFTARGAKGATARKQLAADER